MAQKRKPGMLKFEITMSDTITYSRTYSITKEFATEEEAEAWAEERRDDVEAYSEANGGCEVEEQIDNDPWEISVKEVFAHDPAHCPSDHWNRGDDICADCGANLG